MSHCTGFVDHTTDRVPPLNNKNYVGEVKDYTRVERDRVSIKSNTTVKYIHKILGRETISESYLQ